jgi:dephospho-CoA kinase
MNDTADKNTGNAPGHLLIGLTGGIGSGKSTVATLFEKLGARIIDTDLISRELTQAGGAAIPAIQDTFGASFIDQTGALDRNQMRTLVFANPAAKQQLETILHPLILKRAHQLAGLATLAPYTLVVIPLLFEAQGYQNWLRRTLVVDCPEEMQIARTVQRSGLDQAMVQTIISQQITRNRRIALSDDIICNDQDLPALSARVALLHQLFLQIASGSD